MSLTFPRRWMVPVAAAAALGLAATPAAADQVRQREWWLNAVHVTTAWKSGSGGVTVAVLDSGVDATQPDLAGSVKAGPDYTHSGEASGSPYWGGHGTGVAALIAGHGHGTARADGTIGIAPAARILSIRVVPDRGDPALADPAVASRLPDAIAAGIRYAAAHGAKVIDLPLDPGTTDAAGHRGVSAAGGGSTAERKAVRYALAMGVVLVAPAGDNRAHGGAANYPAGYPGVLAVGAIDRQFDLARFSSGRSYVALTGPGVDVATARPGGDYTTVNSTAAASAVVAGVAALVRAEYPALPASQVAQALTQGTLFRHAKRAGSGYGAVDAAGALRAAAAISAASGRAPASPAASPSAGAAGPAQPASGFMGNVLRYLIAAAVAAAIIVAVLLVALAGLRRRRARRQPQYGPAPDSPLSGGLSRPATTEDAQNDALASPPGRDRRPRLAPVTGLPGRDGVKPQAPPSSGPPWEDAPMPERPAPTWPAADPSHEVSAERPWPAVGTAAEPGMPSRWPSVDDAPGQDRAFGLPDGHGAPGTADGAGRPNGVSGSVIPSPGAARYLQSGDERANLRAEVDGEDTQAFSAVASPGVSSAGTAVADDQDLSEEDEQPFDDEDDRHL